MNTLLTFFLGWTILATFCFCLVKAFGIEDRIADLTCITHLTQEPSAHKVQKTQGDTHHA